MTANRLNIGVKPCQVWWGENVYMVQATTCVADVADSLDGKYFYLYKAVAGVVTKYHVWFNTSGGSAVDPNPGGSTAIVVAITTGDTASAVAAAVATAIGGTAGFDGAAVSSVATITHTDYGYAPLSHEGVGSGFTFAISTEGDAETDVGYTDGDVEIDPTEDKVEVKAQQEGTNLLSEIRTGKTVTVNITFKETSKTQLRALFVQSGGAFTPAGANATEVFGWGTNKDFTQTYEQAKKLRLHPKVRGASDRSEDVTFWKAYGDPDVLNFSGENIQMLPMSFVIYPDATKNTRISYWAYGDSSQTLT